MVQNQSEKTSGNNDRWLQIAVVTIIVLVVAGIFVYKNVIKPEQVIGSFISILSVLDRVQLIRVK